jgi:signal transduction histidine kinase
MRFSLKLALWMLLILTLVLPLYSALFLSRSYDEQIRSQRQDCLDSLSDVRTSMNLTTMAVPEYAWDAALLQTVRALEGEDTVTVLDSSMSPVFGSIADAAFARDVSEAEDTVTLHFNEDGAVMVAVGQLNVYSRRYIIVQKRDIQPLFDRQEQFAWYASVLYLGAVALTALLVFVFSSRFTRPVRRISHAVAAYGRGDFSFPLSVDSKDEIGELARCVRQMAGTIESQIAELAESAKQKELFVASFSHEIKTPLTSVIGYAEMIRRGKANPQTVRLAADYIWNEGMRLETLSQKLMELLRIREGEILFIDVSASAFAEDLTQTLTMLFRDETEVEVAMEDSYLRAEPDLLKTLMINLADNARKAGATHVRIHGATFPDGYRFTVSDNGRGIPQSELKNLTRLFYQLEKDRSSARQGIGLGLALSERITALHGGSLKFESVLGEGTRVSFVVTGGKPDEA